MQSESYLYPAGEWKQRCKSSQNNHRNYNKSALLKMKPRVPTRRTNMRRFLKGLFLYLHFVVGEAAEGKQPAMTSCHSASSKPAVVREFPVRCPDTTWKHFRITSLAVAASFLRKTDERLCHLELRDDFFTCLSWSSAFKPCFPLCGLFSSLSPAPLCIYAWKPEAASFAGRSLLINKTWSGDDDD